MIVYAEYVFLENFIMNYIILSLTGKFAKYHNKQLKLILGAAFGAIYAFVIFFPSLHFLFSILMKLTCSMVIIIIAFTPYKFKDFFRLIGIFYLITLIFGGAGFAFFYFTSFNGIVSNGIFYTSSITAKNVFISCGVSYILIKFCWEYIQRQSSKEKIVMDICIDINKEKIMLKGLVDTGNSLTDPISKYPVIIVEYNKIEEIFPKEVKEIFINNHLFSMDKIFENINENHWITRLRIIPYQALGTENGMLIGFKPDNVLIYNEQYHKDIQDIIVAIYNKKLSKYGDYAALLHPDII